MKRPEPKLKVGDLYFSLHGSMTDGWFIDCYKVVPWPYNPQRDTITTHWNGERKQASTLDGVKSIIEETVGV